MTFRGNRWVPLALGLALGLAGFGTGIAADPHEGMVRVPAAPFIMGADERDGAVGIVIGVDSLPRHTEVLPAFWIDRTEVTNESYREFIRVSGRAAPADPKFKDYYEWKKGSYPEGLDRHPVVYVSWDDADAFCRWEGKRLPSEAEWEKAARGSEGWRYPWGDDWRDNRCNVRETGIEWTTPVGTMEGDMSPYGVMDMCGNVSEWTGSWYAAYPGSTLERPAFGEKYKVVRGGSWMLTREPFARTTNRTLAFETRKRHRGIGFRCAASATEPAGK